MLRVEIPGWKTLEIENLVLDVNGTIAVDGMVSEEIAARIGLLKADLKIFLLTAGTQGRLEEIGKQLQVEVVKIIKGEEGAQKRDYVSKLGSEKTVAVGNGANDELMLAGAALGIAVLEEEGLASQLVGAADVLVRDAGSALDLLINPLRLKATLRR